MLSEQETLNQLLQLQRERAEKSQQRKTARARGAESSSESASSSSSTPPSTVPTSSTSSTTSTRTSTVPAAPLDISPQVPPAETGAPARAQALPPPAPTIIPNNSTINVTRPSVINEQPTSSTPISSRPTTRSTTTRARLQSPTLLSSSSQNATREDKPARVGERSVSATIGSKQNRDSAARGAAQVHFPVPADTGFLVATLQRIISGVWCSTPSLVNFIQYVVFIFRAPLISLMHLTGWVITIAFILSIVGWSACKSEYLSFFPICHATERSPLCTIPYSHHLLIFCPMKTSSTPVNVSELVKPMFQYLYMINVTESNRNLPYVLSEHQAEMMVRAVGLMTSRDPEAVELSQHVESYAELLEPGTEKFDILSFQVFLFETDIRLALDSLRRQMYQYEHRSFFSAIFNTGPLLTLLGFGVTSYNNMWIDFISSINKTATQVHTLASEAKEDFSSLYSQHYGIVRASRKLHKDRTDLLLSYWGGISWVYKRKGITDLEDVMESLGKLRDACTQTTQIIDLIHTITKDIVQSSVHLNKTLHERREVWDGPNIEAQIRIVSRLREMMKEAKDRGEKARQDDARMWGALRAKYSEEEGVNVV